jgi:hypothetical protein
VLAPQLSRPIWASSRRSSLVDQLSRGTIVYRVQQAAR